MRLTKHEDGWIYGIFCSESKDPDAAAGDLTSAVAVAGIIRTKDLRNWERLPNLISKSQQRNVVCTIRSLSKGNMRFTPALKTGLLKQALVEEFAGH